MTSGIGSGLVIAAVGDFMISRRPTREEIARTRPLFAGADLVVANVDTVLSDAGIAVPKWANLRGPREAAADLRAMGIDVAILANNHAMDFGAEGLLDAIAAFEETGILVIGAGRNLAQSTQPHLVERGGVTVALMAIACTLPPGSAATVSSPGIAPVRVGYAFELEASLGAEQPGSMPKVRSWVEPDDLARVVNDIETARDRADTVVAFVHWGVPEPWRTRFQDPILGYQRELAQAIVAAGATAVVGSHSHELHGIEWLDGAPVAYSVGNFWIDTIERYDWMGKAAIDLRLHLGSAGLGAVEARPLMLDRAGLPHGDESGAVVALLEALSATLGAHVHPKTYQVTAIEPRSA